MSVQSLQVALDERSYPILIGPGLLAGHEALERLVTGRQVAVVTNARVQGLYGATLERALSSARTRITVELPEGESHKDWHSLNQVFDTLLGHQFDRRSLIIGLGGGVIGDMAGFAAAVYQRGIDFVQVPTTLLAQVDSSVGGKTAINHPLGKNMIGAFHQPRLVLADTEALTSLPAREISAGIAEMIKHGAIADPDYLATLERDMAALRAGDASRLARAVLRSCEIKAQVVGADERESGIRATLNFGHTFGHAIEAGAGYGQWLHGEAVGAGMVMAADLSHRLGLVPVEVRERIRAAVVRAGLPERGPAWPAERYLELMSVDKKANQGVPRFVVLESLGRASMREAPVELVRATLRDCCGGD